MLGFDIGFDWIRLTWICYRLCIVLDIIFVMNTPCHTPVGGFFLKLFDPRFMRFYVILRVPRPRDLANRVRRVCEMQKNAFISQIELSRVVS